MKIKCFGIMRDFSGTGEVDVTLHSFPLTVAELKQKLELQFPELRSIKNYFIAVNHEYGDDEQLITPDDELAIIPPVSGG